MKFAIVGAGVMGSLVGAMLVNAGAEVWLVNCNQEITNAIRQNGLRITIKDQDEHITINAVQSLAEINQKMDVMIFLVKGCHTDAAAKSSLCLSDDHTYVMTLQNGIGNVDILAKYYHQSKILYGILEFAGKTIEPGHVQGLISENSKICFGPTSKIITAEIKQIADFLQKSGLKVVLKENIDNEVWIKLRNNSNNAVFGLLRQSIGQALSAAGTEEVMAMVRNEVIEVAKAKGIQFTAEELSINQGKTPVNPELYAHLPSISNTLL